MVLQKEIIGKLTGSGRIKSVGSNNTDPPAYTAVLTNGSNGTNGTNGTNGHNNNNHILVTFNSPSTRIVPNVDTEPIGETHRLVSSLD